MTATYRNILSPTGDIVRPARTPSARKESRSGKPVIGLIDNSKPNVAQFVQALAESLRSRDEYEVVTVAKARSAGPYEEIAALADRCRYVINAVAD